MMATMRWPLVILGGLLAGALLAGSFFLGRDVFGDSNEGCTQAAQSLANLSGVYLAQLDAQGPFDMPALAQAQRAEPRAEAEVALAVKNCPIAWDN